LDDGLCTAASIEIDPDEGCRTYAQASALIPDDEWDEQVSEMEEDWDELGFEEDEDDDFWLELDEEDFE
jgi:hypothetical protein